jgi:hypothetical protein
MQARGDAPCGEGVTWVRVFPIRKDGFAGAGETRPKLREPRSLLEH